MYDALARDFLWINTINAFTSLFLTILHDKKMEILFLFFRVGFIP